ncbi:MAG: arginine--tRNA ligase, partial [Actinomycetes bacterium]
MTPAELTATVLTAFDAAVAAGDLELREPGLRPDVRVERPRQKEHGDYATNLALTLAKTAGRPPREVAEVLAAHLKGQPGIAAVEVAGPGFLNITLDDAAQGELARSVLVAGEAYGRNETLSGKRINLEFVSANPTGPVHMGGTRWAAVGDSLARVLSASGAHVTREYYFNDHGAQIDRFARSLLA